MQANDIQSCSFSPSLAAALQPESPSKMPMSETHPALTLTGNLIQLSVV